VTGRRGSPLPRWAAASAVSHARRVDVPRVAPAEAPPAALPATRSRHETTPATTVASLAIGPRSVDSHDAASPTSHRWRRSQLCSWHTQASSYLQRHRPQQLSSTLMSREHTPSSVAALATTRLTGGASTPAPPIFVAVSGEHRLLTGVYYIPVLRNSIISLGQLDESGSRVEIKNGVMRIWDHHRRLLAKVTRGTNRLYVLNLQVAQPLSLAARRDDEA
jgi:hypothetical protein